MLIPAGILASLMVGAGMFSLPYIFVRAGILYGFIALIFFAFISASINFRYARIIDKDGKDKRFIGYAKKYLNNKGYICSLVFVLGGILFTLAVYLSISFRFFALIFPDIPEIVTVLIFWTIGTMLVFLGIQKGSVISFFVFIAMAIIIAFFGIFALAQGRLENIGNIILFDFRNIFLPFGPLLFAFAGRAAISAMREYYKEAEYSLKKIKQAIGLGIIIPAVIYIVFIAATIILSEKGVSPEAVLGLTGIPAWGLFAIGAIGILAILDSYVLLGIELNSITIKDLKLPKAISYVLFAIIPMIIYLFGSSDFLKLVAITGGVFLAGESIMVVLMGRKAFGRSLSDIFLITIFVLGIFYEITKLF